MKALGALDRITGKDENVRAIEEALDIDFLSPRRP
jgi:hypothetical protein